MKPAQHATPPFDIAAVGLGIVGVHHLTREAHEIIRRCSEVFFIDTGYGEARYLRELCPRVTSLLPLYGVGESRLPTYRKMAATSYRPPSIIRPSASRATGIRWCSVTRPP